MTTSRDLCWADTTVNADIYDRVIDILDRHTEIRVLPTRRGGTVLDWETTQQLATAIAGDPVLAQLFARQSGGAG